MAELIARARRFERNMAPLVRPFDALAESIAYQQLSGKGRSHDLAPGQSALSAPQMARSKIGSGHAR